MLASAQTFQRLPGIRRAALASVYPTAQTRDFRVDHSSGVGPTQQLPELREQTAGLGVGSGVARSEQRKHLDLGALLQHREHLEEDEGLRQLRKPRHHVRNAERLPGGGDHLLERISSGAQD